MAYFLGREVAVYFNTESLTNNESIYVDALVNGACIVGNPGTAPDTAHVFADDMEGGTALSGYNQVTDVTGVDISIGATDEDITYIGQKTTGKVEIKKEMTVSVTRKKKNNTWDVIYNGPTAGSSAMSGSPTDQGARWGLNTAKVGNGLVNPKDVTDGSTDSEYGYRITVQIGNTSATGEVLCFPNCTINSYSTSLSADGVTEETIEFGTMMTIVYGADGVSLNATLTATSEM